MNIVLIMSDTFRRDHLGCYGNKDIHTPHLDKFAQEKCIQFDRCYSSSYPTMPNRADLFTGRFTSTYLGWAPLPREEKVLAEILLKKGYTTLAAVDTPFFVRGDYNYDRGFKDFVWVPGQGAERLRINSERRHEEDFCAPRTMLTAEKLLEYYYKEKFFLYVDTWDPHEPWDPPRHYGEKYYSEYRGQLHARPSYWEWREAGLKEEDIKFAHSCYCGEVSMVDFWVGRLIDKIESLGILDNTVILFTSDHGYYFGEHGYFGKGRHREHYWYSSPLYQEVTRIPLLIHVPGISHRQIEAIVSVIDLMPTLLELAEVKIPETVHGKSLVPVIEGKKEAVRDFAVTSEFLYNLGDKTRIVDGILRGVKELQPATITSEEWTLLYTAENHPAELYNIKHDPKQTQNVIKENWQIAKDLHQKYVKFLEQINTDERYLSIRRELSRM